MCHLEKSKSNSRLFNEYFYIKELAEELGVGSQTILNKVDNSKRIFAQCYISDSINTGATDNLEASEEAFKLPNDIDIQTDLIKKNKEC